MNTAVHSSSPVSGGQEYGALLAYLGDPPSGFITQTLPFDGGFEISVKVIGN